MNVIKNISFGAIMVSVFLFASFLVSETVYAYDWSDSGSDCGSCETTPPTGGNDDDDNSNPPRCDISTDLSVVEQGEQYTISWKGSPANATFEVNDYPVSAEGQHTYTFTAENQSRFVFTGQNGDGNCVDEVIVKRKTVPQPSCDLFEIEPTNLPAGGGAVTITWNTTNAQEVRLDGVVVADDGTQTVTVTEDTAFDLDVTNAAGSDHCGASVHVDDPDPVPVCDFFAIAESQVAPGATITLNWGTSNVSDVSINQGVGGVAVDGPATRNAPSTPGTYEYVLTFDGATNADCRDTIHVVADHSGLTCSDLSFTSNASVVEPGTAVTLEWVWTGNVSSGVVDQGIGAVNSGDTRTVTIDQKTTYTTTIANATDSVQCPLTIDIKPTTPSICEGVDIGASNTSVVEGDNINLGWSWTQNYDEVRITNGIGVVSNNDSRTVRINDDVTYAIEVTRGNTTESCDSVTIDARNRGGGGGGSSSPRCKYFEASDDEINAGDRVVLRWATSRTNEVTLFEGTMRNGDEIFTTDDDDEVDEGEFVVRPTEDTTYTLHLERGSRDRTCKVDIEVEDNIVVLSTRNQEPRVAGIALTAVPYTGFEAGPTLTILFYVLLALWGLFVAYTFTVKRDRVLGFSLNGAFPRKQSVTDVSTETTDEEEGESEAAAYVATATAPAAPINLPTGNAPVSGYANVAVQESTTEETEETEDVSSEADAALTDLENRAHAQHALLSSDAMRYFVASYSSEEQFEALDALIRDAKKQYPSEDGWVVINLERVQKLMDVTDVVSELSSTPTSAGSLAEAIVSSNTAAALSLVGERPMVALADAATELDTLYRMRMGGDETVSDLLASNSTHLTDQQVADVLHALNSALDGTYTNETDAVKTAVLKAIHAAA